MGRVRAAVDTDTQTGLLLMAAVYWSPEI